MINKQFHIDDVVELKKCMRALEEAGLNFTVMFTGHIKGWKNLVYLEVLKPNKKTIEVIGDSNTYRNGFGFRGKSIRPPNDYLYFADGETHIVSSATVEVDGQCSCGDAYDHTFTIYIKGFMGAKQLSGESTSDRLIGRAI